MSLPTTANDRIPAALVRREGWLALLLAVLVLAGSEFLLRALGAWPGITDTRLWWAMQRARAEGGRVIVLAGSSRAQLGLEPEAFAGAFPDCRVVHLGIYGATDFAVVRDLALDPGFAGLVVLEFPDWGLLKIAEDTSREWVDFYRGPYPRASYWEKRLNEWMRVAAQSRLALASPAMGLGTLVLVGPYRSYETLRASRFRPAYYRGRLSPEKLRQHRDHRLDQTRWLVAEYVRDDNEARLAAALADELKPLYRALKARGGELVMVRMPTTGEHWTLDQAAFPRERFWNAIGPATGVPTIHFADYPELSRFECPDLSHLDAEDAPEFSRALARIIREKTGWPGAEPHER